MTVPLSSRFKGGFVGSAIASTLAFLVLIIGRMPETLAPENVKALTTVNPLSFLALFKPRGIYSRDGKSVGRLATVLALQKGTQIPAITEARTGFLLYLGWQPVARANYLTTVGAVGMISYRLQGSSVAWFGPRMATRLGNLAQACVMVGTGLSRSAAALYASLIPGMPFAAEGAVETALSAHADLVGIGQGKLNADLGNMIVSRRRWYCYYPSPHSALYGNSAVEAVNTVKMTVPPSSRDDYIQTCCATLVADLCKHCTVAGADEVYHAGPVRASSRLGPRARGAGARLPVHGRVLPHGGGGALHGGRHREAVVSALRVMFSC